MSNEIQSLLNKGSVDRGILETTADVLLTLPRSLWLGKSVTVITTDQKPEIIPRRTPTDKQKFGWKDFFNLGNSLPALVIGLVAAVTYLGVSVLAFPFLAVGGILKKIALNKDPKAEQFHQIVMAQLHKEVLETKKFEIEKKQTCEDDNLRDELNQRMTSIFRKKLTNHEPLPTDEVYIKMDSVVSQVHSLTDPKGEIPALKDLGITLSSSDSLSKTIDKIVTLPKEINKLNDQIKSAEAACQKALSEFIVAKTSV